MNLMFCTFRWLLLATVCGTALPAYAAAPMWTPTRNVEFIVPSGAGGGNDQTARVIQKIWQDHNLLNVTSTVVNKPGGGGAIASAYLQHRSGDPHYVSIASITWLTTKILSKDPIKYSDYTPLSVLFSEYVAFTVKADSPIRTGNELIDRIRTDPGSFTIALSAALGNANHIAVAKVMKAAGGDVRKLKIVVFKSNAESTTALLGGHVDMVLSPGSVILPHLRTRTLRTVAVAAPRRLSGPLSDIPTWKESGIDVSIDNWRGVLGAKALTQAQVFYWDDVFAKVVKTDAWLKSLEAGAWESNYMNSRDSTRYISAQHDELRSILTELGLIKQ